MKRRIEIDAGDSERGAALLLVIAFMVVMGAISAAVISTATSGIQERAVLDKARDRQYAADAAIETMVVATRDLSGASCPPVPTTPFMFNTMSIHVDCAFVPAVVVGQGIPKLQKNYSFVACSKTGASSYGDTCTPSTTIISAQVNFQGLGSNVVTYVQSWSVNA